MSTHQQVHTNVFLCACECVSMYAFPWSALAERFLCMYRLYCYHVCPQPPQFSLFSGNDLTNRSTTDPISVSLFFFFFCHSLTSGGLSHCRVGQACVCTYQMCPVTWILRHTYRSCKTYSICNSHPLWFTLVFTDELRMNHRHTLPCLVTSSTDSGVC